MQTSASGNAKSPQDDRYKTYIERHMLCGTAGYPLSPPPIHAVALGLITCSLFLLPPPGRPKATAGDMNS